MSGVKHIDIDSVTMETEVANNVVLEDITDVPVNKHVAIASSEDEIKDYVKRSMELKASLTATLKSAGWKITGLELKLERLQGYRVAHQ